MAGVAARDLSAARAIRAALGDPAPKGALTRLARELGVSAATVSRWYSLASSPDRTLWPTVEAALGMQPGALRDAATPPDEVAELRAMVAEQGRQLAALTQRVEDLDAGIAQLRRAAARGAAGSR